MSKHKSRRHIRQAHKEAGRLYLTDRELHLRTVGWKYDEEGRTVHIKRMVKAPQLTPPTNPRCPLPQNCGVKRELNSGVVSRDEEVDGEGGTGRLEGDPP